MAFDLSSVLAQAAEFNNSSERRDFKYKIVYPGPGATRIKLLFNPKANKLMRKINRHTVGESKIPCMRTWNQECPICKFIEDLKNTKGIDLGLKMKSTTRGLAFAHYISMDSAKNNEYAPKQGDIVLFMFPWTVYQGINQIVKDNSSNPANIEQMIAINEGYGFVVNRGTDNKYQVSMDPFKKYATCDSQEEFESLLTNMESLDDQILPESGPTEDHLRTIQEALDELKGQYLTTPATPGVETPMVSVGQQMTQKTAPESAPQAPVTSTPTHSPDGIPDCLGHYGTKDEDTCSMCTVELVCMKKTKANANGQTNETVPF